MDVYKLYDRAATFGDDHGLRCFRFGMGDVSDPRYELFVVYPNKFSRIIMNACYGKSLSALEKLAQTHQKRGYHTYISTFAGTSSKYVNRDVVDMVPKCVDLVFHEGFHRRKDGMLKQKWLEESAASVVGNRLSLAFAQEYGDEPLLEKIVCYCEREVANAKKLVTLVDERNEAFRLEKEIDANDEWNNARIYAHYPYYGTFELMGWLYDHSTSCEDFISTLKLLPTGFEDARKLIKKMQKMTDCKD